VKECQSYHSSTDEELVENDPAEEVVGTLGKTGKGDGFHLLN
jgi:hypothetical protein